MEWHDYFDEREMKELEFSKIYAQSFSHGTDGHNRLLLLSKLQLLLNQHEEQMKEHGVKDKYNRARDKGYTGKVK